MAKVKTDRKPAPVVKCKHCDWRGSARGLFTHVRLGHPGIKDKPPVMTHPYDVNTKINDSIGRIPKKKVKPFKVPNITLEDVTIAALVIFLIRAGIKANDKKKAELLSRAQKLNIKPQRINEKELDEIVASLSGIV